MAKKKTLKKARKMLVKRARSFSEEIAPLYRVLHWEWVQGNLRKIPDATEIYNSLCDLINGCEDKSTCGSGGLTVHINTQKQEASMMFSIDEELFW